jgi:undecaprenyl pyrophosphate synthase
MQKIAHLPNHVGIIPDGNRRWAKKRGLSLWDGYMAGYAKLKAVVKHLFNVGVKNVSVYAMSLDNFLKRSEYEVKVLMKLAKKGFKELREDKDLNEKGVKVSIVGELNYLPDDVREEALKLMEQTSKGKGGTLYVVFLYSVSEEIKKSMRMGVKPFTLEIPPIDLIIRTGGMKRISGFLPLASIYAELYFTNTLWPDITIEEIDEALKWYSSVQRRFGA